ncbi:MAG: anti-sigma factor [Alphaproteobacteria bacterium]|nr:anti-sigma factor [Alphaproteobacteria bacterium]
MLKPNDEILIAYLDGELGERETLEVMSALARDGDLRAHADRLNASARLIRAAYDDVLRDVVPARLIAAARGERGLTTLQRALARLARWRAALGERPWWIGVPVVASLLGLMIGGGLGYLAGTEQNASLAAQQDLLAVNAGADWLDNVAGYHKLLIKAGSNDRALMDVPADTSGDTLHKAGQLPPNLRLPNLKPWSLQFQGARFLVIDGQPATQLFYTTDNKNLGALTFVEAVSTKPDLAPTFDRRDGLNVLYWRHHGHAYALVGTADIGYLWNIYNDIAWQLDAI